MRNISVMWYQSHI